MSVHCQKNARIGLNLCFYLQKIEHLYHLYFSFYNLLYYENPIFSVCHYTVVAQFKNMKT
jgi:hypothetical protein